MRRFLRRNPTRLTTDDVRAGAQVGEPVAGQGGAQGIVANWLVMAAHPMVQCPVLWGCMAQLVDEDALVRSLRRRTSRQPQDAPAERPAPRQCVLRCGALAAVSGRIRSRSRDLSTHAAHLDGGATGQEAASPEGARQQEPPLHP